MGTRFSFQQLFVNDKSLGLSLFELLLHGCWRGIANLGPIIGNNEVDVIV